MAYKIEWTKSAINGFDSIVQYLETQWSEKEVKNFFQSTIKFLKLLQNNPRLLRLSPSKKNLYRGPINKQTIVTYRIYPKKKVIQLINIRGAKQEPLDF